MDGNWFSAVGGASLPFLRFSVIYVVASGLTGKLPHSAPLRKGSPVYRPPFSDGLGGGRTR